MSDKAKYILFSLLEYGLSFGGCAAVIVMNFIDETASLGYKLTFGGVVLIVALLLYSKGVFEKSYREKYDTLLQQLAEATSAEVKAAISEKINAHKLKNEIYQRLTLLLPFAILYIVTYLGSVSLAQLQSTVGLILASLGAGSVFNVVKKPIGDRLALAKITKKIKS